MLQFERMYEKYENTKLHKGIKAVEEAEEELAAKMKEICETYDGIEEKMEELDVIIGKIARVYEKQGFAFAEEVRKALSTGKNGR